MDKAGEAKKNDVVVFLDMDKKIGEKDIEGFLSERSIKFSNIEFENLVEKTRNIKITFEPDAIAYTQFELLKGQTFPKFDKQTMQLDFISSSNNQAEANQVFKEDEPIVYEVAYDKLLMTDFERRFGSDGIIFKNTEIIDKQRAVAGYLIKNIGLNLIKGKSIMNVSLPINIFDKRSLLEMYAWQNGYAAIILEKAGLQTDKMERLKYTTAFALTRFSLSGAQLKPFNPVLGETFQCKFLDSMYYAEQTCHHPPILNFYAYGKNYKIYGHNESDAATGANSVKIYYKGNFIVQYPDGTKHQIIYPTMKLSGTMVGNRSINFRGILRVIDETNDLLSEIELDPDDRGFFKKMTSKKQTYPDYFRGVITSISKNTKFDKKEKTLTIVDAEKHVLSSIEGEFTDHLKFDGTVYWKLGQDQFPGFRRMAFTLPSDSTFREDLIWFKKDNENMAQKYKVKLEEIQRNDKTLRETNTKKNSEDTKKDKKKK